MLMLLAPWATAAAVAYAASRKPRVKNPAARSSARALKPARPAAQRNQATCWRRPNAECCYVWGSGRYRLVCGDPGDPSTRIGRPYTGPTEPITRAIPIARVNPESLLSRWSTVPSEGRDSLMASLAALGYHGMRLACAVRLFQAEFNAWSLYLEDEGIQVDAPRELPLTGMLDAATEAAIARARAAEPFYQVPWHEQVRVAVDSLERA